MSDGGRRWPRIVGVVVAALIVLFLIVLLVACVASSIIRRDSRDARASCARAVISPLPQIALPCHTAEGGVPYAGGREFKLPFGTLYAPNITPDRRDWHR